MSDTPQSDTPQSGGAAGIRQIVLLIILALAVVALIWEFMVARPQSTAAWKAVSELLASNYAAAGEVTNTNKEVQDAVGKAPSRVTSDEPNKAVEHYTWRRGLPFLSYSIRVIYDKKEDGRLLLNTASADTPPVEDDAGPAAGGN